LYIGKRVLVKYNGELKEGNVETIYFDYLDIKLDDGTIIQRKFWEIGKIKRNPNEEE